MKKSCKNQESGRSIIEIIGVLGLMGLISVGAFVLIRSGMANQRRTMIVDDVSKIVTGVRSLYADYDDYSALEFDGVQGEKALAAISVGTDGPYDNIKYGLYAKKTSPDTFIVEVSGLSDSDCAIFGTQSWPGAVSGAKCKKGKVVIEYK